MKNIIMQYPIGSSNELYDGKPHNIRPIRLGVFTVGGREFYIMDYFDLDYGCDCTTILTEINGVFVKVPLDNYELLDQLLEGLDIETVNPNVLSERIAVSQMLPINQLILAKTKPTLELDMDIYIPYNVRFNPTNVNQRLFSSRGLIYSDGNQEYEFDKMSDSYILNGVISKSLEDYRDKLERKQTFVLEIRNIVVPPGSTSHIQDKENRLLQQLLIPGIWNLHVLVTPCINKDKNHKVLECYDCSIDAPAKAYDGLHDKQRVFRGGYLDRLDMKFDGIPFEKTKLR